MWIMFASYNSQIRFIAALWFFPLSFSCFPPFFATSFPFLFPYTFVYHKIRTFCKFGAFQFLNNKGTISLVFFSMLIILYRHHHMTRETLSNTDEQTTIYKIQASVLILYSNIFTVYPEQCLKMKSCEWISLQGSLA